MSMKHTTPDEHTETIRRGFLHMAHTFDESTEFWINAVPFWLKAGEPEHAEHARRNAIECRQTAMECYLRAQGKWDEAESHYQDYTAQELTRESVYADTLIEQQADEEEEEEEWDPTPGLIDREIEKLDEGEYDTTAGFPERYEIEEETYPVNIPVWEDPQTN